MRRKVFIPIIIIITLAGVFTACVQFRESTTQMRERFPDARIEYAEYEGRTLRYLTMHRNDSFPTLFFLHGSPSSMSVYNVYYSDSTLAQWANIIAVDRPGYGFSDLGRSEKSVRRQAEKMWKILEKEGFPSPLYIVGSSYGGTVAAKMAMLEPDRIDGMVLVSASLAPGEERIYPISYLIRYIPFRWLVPRMVRVANDEKLAHYQALKDMLPYWDRIISPVVMIQGTNDRLIYPENVQFALERLVNAQKVEYHMMEGEGHFLQIKYKDFIVDRLRWLLEITIMHESFMR